MSTDYSPVFVKWGNEQVNLHGATLPPTPFPTLTALAEAQDYLLKNTPQVPIRTEHVIHGGMYVRTVRLEPDTLICGCLYKVPTVLIVHGTGRVFVGDGWADVSGYTVVPASAGRKQLFLALSPMEITMVFRTDAKTVDEAEKEMTDEWEVLVSRHSDNDLITVTGE